MVFWLGLWWRMVGRCGGVGGGWGGGGGGPALRFCEGLKRLIAAIVNLLKWEK